MYLLPSIKLFLKQCHPVINIANGVGVGGQHELVKPFGRERGEVRSMEKDAILGHELREDTTSIAVVVTCCHRRKQRLVDHSCSGAARIESNISIPLHL
jgi:hypothetical protein